MSTNDLISMNTNLKTLRMQNAFQQRLATGDMTTKRDLRTLGAVETSEEDNSRLEQIRAKLQCGGKLTETEREYLKKKDPKAYADLVKEEEDQKNFERSLRRCRTRGEVDRLKFSRIGQSLSNLKAAERDSSLSQEEKLAVAARELRNINHAIKATDEYLRGVNGGSSALRAGSAEAKLRSLLKEHLEDMAGRVSERDRKRYDTFISSDSRSFADIQNDAIEAVKKLYESKTEDSEE